MASESQDSIENDGNESKEEHIKQRLKELGVSEDSERPKKSFIGKHGKYILLGTIAALVIAYGFEYNRQVNDEDKMTADGGNSAMQQQASPYNYAQPMQPPAWVQEHQTQMQQRPEPPEWVKQRRAQMQQRQAWLQQQMRMQNAPINNPVENARNSYNSQGNTNQYYVQPYPYPYWQSYPGYHNNGYPQWNTYRGNYNGGYPYYNGWQR